MNVDEAFADACNSYFQPLLVPVTMTGETEPDKQLDALLEAAGGDTPAGLKTVAAWIGTVPDTVRRWVRGQRGIAKSSRTKLSAAYGDQILEPKRRRKQVRADNTARRTARDRLSSRIADARVKVTAVIRWSNSKKKQYNATKYRTTTLDNIDLTRAVDKWARGQPAGAALQRAVAQQYGVEQEGGIAFEGDSVEIEINPR